MAAIPNIRNANSGMTRSLPCGIRNNSLHKKGWVNGHLTLGFLKTALSRKQIQPVFQYVPAG